MHPMYRILAPLLVFGCDQNPIDALADYADDICACERDGDCIDEVRARWEEANVRLIATSELGETERELGMAHVQRALECSE